MKNRIEVSLSPEAKQTCNFLNEKARTSKSSRMILDAINNKLELIKADSHYGNPVAKKLIPREYIMKHGISNLFRVELPLFWRMLYTLTKEDDIQVIAIVMDICCHQDYNRKFGYRNR